jgi:Subtilase family
MTRRVIIELRGAPSTRRMAQSAEIRSLSTIANIKLDASFAPVPVPSGTPVPPEATEDIERAFGLTMDRLAGEEQTYIVRGTLEDEPADIERLSAESAVVGVFADVAINPLITCGGSPAVGDDKRVEELLCVPKLKQAGLDGSGVCVAVVDTGINLAYLNSKGKFPSFDLALSWKPPSSTVVENPGALPIGHGTMCAFDACIAAPNCTLLDIAVLLSETPGGTVMEGYLSDAVTAYGHLRTVLRGSSRPKALVVTNSWGMFHPSWDFPIGHPGNYSDNANHPFNRIVRTLEREGADILFAAGNCGNECPDGRCGGATNAIYGANSHPKVLSVAGVDTNLSRVGYSTKGPGRLTREKPDIAGYTHFKGAFPVDGGTSAATPVVAGVIAALRTQWPYDSSAPATWPIVVRDLIKQTATDRGPAGFDFEYGFGIVNACALSDMLTQAIQDETSEYYPPTRAGRRERQSETSIEVESRADVGLQSGFVRLSRDGHPGTNTHHLVGLPQDTRTISIWVTEWTGPNNPHASAAIISTSSVQLYENGTKCRFVFSISGGSTLPVACQYIFGPG